MHNFIDRWYKIFISEKNKYCIRYDDNKSICINILNRFKDIKKCYEINVIDLTDNYYNIDKSNIKKYCTILLIYDIITSRIFISEKNMYYIRCDDADDYDEPVYYKILNDFDHIEKSDRNNIVNLINNNNYNHDMTSLVDDSKIFVYEKIDIFIKLMVMVYLKLLYLLLNYKLSYILKLFY